MDYKEIALIVKKGKYCIPERIFLRTGFFFHDKNSCEQQMEVAHTNLISFLQEKNIDFAGPEEGTVRAYRDDHAFEYQFFSYLLTLTFQSHPEIENYRVNHPEFSGCVISAVFQEEDKNNFLKKVITQAQKRATKLAKTKGLTLRKEYEMTEVDQMEEWIIGPPFHATIIHFKQKLKGQYKFVFKAGQ